jgi:Fic family protein
VAWNPDGCLPPSSGSEVEASSSLALTERLFEIIEDAVGSPESFRITPKLICDLHAVGARGIVSVPGAYRDGPSKIEFARHVPPPHTELDALMAEMCAEIHRRASDEDRAGAVVDAAGYALWRLNWIHPFEDGNGRTARAVCYLVMCWCAQLTFPGNTAVPERILREKTKYYRCLESADEAWKRPAARPNALNQVKGFLGRLLRAQLRDVD